MSCIPDVRTAPSAVIGNGTEMIDIVEGMKMSFNFSFENKILWRFSILLNIPINQLPIIVFGAVKMEFASIISLTDYNIILLNYPNR